MAARGGRKAGGIYGGLQQLGAPTGIPRSHEAAVLERVPNPHPRKLYLARFTAPEFTSLCPITGQPDFAHLVLDYRLHPIHNVRLPCEVPAIHM